MANAHFKRFRNTRYEHKRSEGMTGRRNGGSHLQEGEPMPHFCAHEMALVMAMIGPVLYCLRCLKMFVQGHQEPPETEHMHDEHGGES